MPGKTLAQDQEEEEERYKKERRNQQNKSLLGTAAYTWTAGVYASRILRTPQCYLLRMHHERYVHAM